MTFKRVHGPCTLSGIYQEMAFGLSSSSMFHFGLTVWAWKYVMRNRWASQGDLKSLGFSGRWLRNKATM